MGAPYTSGPQCDAAAVWNGKHLFAAANKTTINGTTFAGSIRMVNPATGAVLRTIATGPDFGQPVFADNMMLVPTQNNGLWAYKSG